MKEQINYGRQMSGRTNKNINTKTNHVSQMNEETNKLRQTNKRKNKEKLNKVRRAKKQMKEPTNTKIFEETLK